MLPDRVSNPGPLTYESGALPIALRGPAAATLESNLVIHLNIVWQWLLYRYCSLDIKWHPLSPSGCLIGLIWLVSMPGFAYRSNCHVKSEIYLKSYPNNNMGNNYNNNLRKL